LFQVNGAAGRTIQFTFTGIPSDHWSAIRPVVGYGTDLSDPAFFEPDANGQSKWQFMKDCHVDDPKNITYTWHFTQSSAYVALRVPYTLEYQQRYLASLPKQKGLDIITIGHSAEGRPLTLIKIGRGDEQAEKENPCILMYAREHCDEPDSSWAVQGALRFLISNSPEAEKIRQKFTFLLIPMLDPDGWARGVHENIFQSFSVVKPTIESQRYAEWFEKRVNRLGRLDVAVNVHNPAPGCRWQVMLDVAPPDPSGLEECVAINRFVRASLIDSHLRVLPRIPKKAVVPNRMSGWLSTAFGCLPVLYEISGQNESFLPSLSVAQTGGISVIKGISQYLISGPGSSSLRNINIFRQRRQLRWDEAHLDVVLAGGPIASELRCRLAINTAKHCHN
jgi:hypothetical protein